MRMRLSRFLLGTLRGRLIISVALVHAVMMSLFIVDLTVRQRALLLNRQIEEATALSSSLATTAAEWIAADDVAGLQELVDAQRRYPEIVFAILTDKAGRVLADTDRSRQGLYMLDVPADALPKVLSRTPSLVDVAAPAMVGSLHVGWARVGIGQKAAGETLAQITRSGILYALAAILIGSTIAWFMGLLITRRLYAVQATINAVRSGNRLARSPVAGADEAAVMGREFNTMLDALGERDAELRTSEEKYRSLIRKVQTAIVLHDRQGRVLDSNPLAQELLGLSADQLLGRTLIDPDWHFLREDGSVLPVEEYPVSLVLSTGQPLRGYVTGVRRPGREVAWVLVNAEPEHVDGGQISLVIVSFVDITERKRAEAEVERLASFPMLNPQPIIEVDNDGRVSFANPAARRLFPDLEQRGPGHPFLADIETLVSSCRDRGVRPDDRDVDVAGRWYRQSMYYMQQERRLRIYGFDITERKRAEESLRRLNRELRALSTCNQVLMRAADEQSLLNDICHIICDEAGYRMAWVGYAEADEARTVRPVAWAGVEDGYLSIVNVTWADTERGRGTPGTAIRTGKSICNQDFATDRDAAPWRESALQRGYRSSVGLPLKDENGKVFGVLQLYSTEPDFFTPDEVRLLEELAGDLAFGITTLRMREERRRVEEALRNVLRHARTIVMHAEVTAPEGWDQHPPEWSAPHYRWKSRFEDEAADQDVLPLELSPGEDYDHGWGRAKHPDDEEPMSMCAARAFVSGAANWHQEFRAVDRYGRQHWFAQAALLEPMEHGRWQVTTINTDITDRKQAEEERERLLAQVERERERAEARAGELDAIFASMTDGVNLYALDGTIVRSNRAAERIFSLTRVSSALTMSERTEQFRSRGEDGQPLTNPDDLPVRRALRGETVDNVVLGIASAQTGEYIWLAVGAAPVLDAAGRATGAVLTFRDITERKRAEQQMERNENRRRELERELIQSQKLESLGTLASGIAHDFNNILAIIAGQSSLLSTSPADPARLRRRVEAIDKASERGASLIRQLLTFARKSEAVFESVSINHIISEVINLLHETLPKTITVSMDLKEGIPSIIADASQVHQVLLNLCVNARDAMLTGGSIAITTTTAGYEEVAAQFPRATDREYVRVTVSDTGVGMDEETKQRIFDPFFTTKLPGKGTGLGLALVHSIVESHRGLIAVQSAPGKGTTFSLCFPVEERAVESPRSTAEVAADIPGGTETILVIEDEEMLMEMVREILVAKGYRVLSARDGEEGVARFAEHRQEIAVVLSDLGLPKFGGDEVFRRIRAIEPHAQVIIASGFIDPDVGAELRRTGARWFIQKPYSPAEALRTIRTVLDLIEP